MEENSSTYISLSDLKEIISLFENFAERGMLRDFETMEKVLRIRNKIISFCQAAEMAVKTKEKEEIKKEEQKTTKKEKK